MINKKWNYPPALDYDQVEKLATKLNIMPITATILIQRGFSSAEEIQTFFSPKGLRLSDYKKLPGTVEAGTLIAEAINKKELIVVFGDYDVDGVTGSALMTEFIRSRGGQVHVHLPDRYKEGYGLNKQFIKKSRSMNAQLLITVDCGVTALEEVAYAKEQGLAVIITDHHEPSSELPQADVVVNPKVAGPESFRLLAGVGVALQVIRATADQLGEKDPEQLRRYLDLVALGTIADVVPLIGENRLLAKAGLAVINRGHRMGLKALVTSAGLGVEPLSSTDLAFRIAPRLNAAGRMGDANHSLALLLANNALEADALAEKLNQDNSERQIIQKDVMELAEKQIDQHAIPNVMVVYGLDWPHGVVGLVAARLCEKYYRPCFALSVNGDEAKGSGRSIKGFSLPQALEQVSPFLVKWGGHEMAAGVTLKKENLDIFRKTLNDFADKMLDQDKLIPELNIDGETTLEQINNKLIQDLKRFEPVGFGNLKPMLVIKGLSLAKPPRVVGDRHLKLVISDNKRRLIDVIGFGLGSRISELIGNPTIDVAGYPGENHWNGATTIQFELKDFKLSSKLD